MWSVGERYVGRKKITLKDLWGPSGPQSRFRAYEELIEVVENLAQARGLSKAQVDSLKESIAYKLHTKI
jgi:hypothetical protein